MKDYYSMPEGYILNPFTFLYTDCPDNLEIPLQKILEGVIEIEEERLDLDLPHIEHLLKLDTLAFIRQGCLYATIKFNKLYKKTYSNFSLYCVEVLGKSVDSVNNYIEAARVMLELIMGGFSYAELPKSMSAALVLKGFTGPDLIHTWREILAELEPHKRTGTRIKNYLYPEPVKKEEIYSKIELPLTVYTKLMECCYKASIPMVKGIEAVISVISNIRKKSDISKFIKWTIDYQKLVDEF